jgi:hypothetical protein
MWESLDLANELSDRYLTFLKAERERLKAKLESLERGIKIVETDDLCTCQLDGKGEACPVHGDIRLV